MIESLKLVSPRTPLYTRLFNFWVRFSLVESLKFYYLSVYTTWYPDLDVFWLIQIKFYLNSLFLVKSNLLQWRLCYFTFSATTCRSIFTGTARNRIDPVVAREEEKLDEQLHGQVKVKGSCLFSCYSFFVHKTHFTRVISPYRTLPLI